MPHTYTPPPVYFERTRVALARIVLPVVYTLVHASLLLLPRHHPLRIYTQDRVKYHRALVPKAAISCQPGRRLPLLVDAAAVYVGLDAISVRVPGPFSLAPWWTIDDKVRIFDRIESLASEAAPPAAGLLHLFF